MLFFQRRTLLTVHVSHWLISIELSSLQTVLPTVTRTGSHLHRWVWRSWERCDGDLTTLRAQYWHPPSSLCVDPAFTLFRKRVSTIPQSKSCISTRSQMTYRDGFVSFFFYHVTNGTSRKFLSPATSQFAVWANVSWLSTFWPAECLSRNAELGPESPRAINPGRHLHPSLSPTSWLRRRICHREWFSPEISELGISLGQESYSSNHYLPSVPLCALPALWGWE